MLHKDHLKKAKENSNISRDGSIYFTHMMWAIYASVLFFVWSILMLIHAFVPQLVGFYVIESLIRYIKRLKRLHPHDPLLKKVHFDESSN